METSHSASFVFIYFTQIWYIGMMPTSEISQMFPAENKTTLRRPNQ